MIQLLELADKNLKVIIITMLNRLKEDMLIMNEKTEKHSKEIGAIKKKNQIKF